LAAPSHFVVARRIPSLFSPEEIARKQSANPKHLQRLKPRPAYIRASKPLEVCQIDHTPTDIHFVEVVEREGVFVGRAYLTLVADVATRSILGFCLTLEKPSALSVALCLAQAMCPKEDWLAARGLERRWPMFGRPRLLVTDSAKEFKGRAFQRGCEDYGIRIRYRDRAASMRAGWSNGCSGSRTRDAPGVDGSIRDGPRRLSRAAARSAQFRRPGAVRGARRDRSQSAAECEDVEDAGGGMGVTLHLIGVWLTFGEGGSVRC
jgi:hypothetical protein